MATKYSNVSTTKKTKAKFKKHYVHEVTSNLTEAKLIANDLAESKRYPYRAAVTLVGDTNVRPYEPIYLDGLPNGMSGYWTVLKVKHIFGGVVARHMMEVIVGTDVIGDVNPNAYKEVETRNVNAEISGQDIGGYSSTLVQYNVPINDTELEVIKKPSVKVTKPATSIATDASSPNLYQNDTPDFSIVKQSLAWKATKGSKLL